MDDAKQQLIEQLKVANNVLVTVSRNPSVDQLASCIGLTLLLNKQGKHAAAVFSGQVPSTLEFLEPEETIEKNTDSLRDFIIALDKSKADKLRYKVEDNVVRIFITPYKTSISQADLEFSEGDFNVDVVVALGVRQQEDLDEAITSHGRILHDATVTSINTAPDTGLGTINWSNPEASSLSEMVAELAQSVGDNLLDQQIATALLTGIVSETERFSNDKTSSQTMSASAALMAAGANQQLVASKLEGSTVLSLDQPPAGDESPAKPEDAGTLRIDHVDQTEPEATVVPAVVTGTPEPGPAPADATEGFLSDAELADLSKPAPTGNVSAGSKLLTGPPTPGLGGTLTANSTEEALDPTSDPLSLPATDSLQPPPQLLDHKPEKRIASTPQPPAEPLWSSAPPAPAPDVPVESLLSKPGGGPSITSPFPISEPTPPPLPAPPAGTPGSAAPSAAWLSPPPGPVASPAPGPDSGSGQTGDDHDRTLSELEESMGSPHAAAEHLDEARDEVDRALASSPDGPLADEPPLQGLSAQPLGGPLHNDNAQPATVPAPDTSPAGQPGDSNSPPPVPPPIPFQFGSPSPPSNPPL